MDAVSPCPSLQSHISMAKDVNLSLEVNAAVQFSRFNCLNIKEIWKGYDSWNKETVTGS